jgi:hypothetical protein
MAIWYNFPRFGIFSPFWYVARIKIWQPRSDPGKHTKQLRHIVLCRTGLPDFSLYIHDSQTRKNVPNEHEIYQMVIKYPTSPSNIPNGFKIYKHFPIYGFLKFTQIVIFNMKINLLATLVLSHALKNELRRSSNLEPPSSSAVLKRVKNKSSKVFVGNHGPSRCACLICICMYVCM